MAINRELKKRIAEDWLSAFPQLRAYTSNKLYKVVGCCIIGIELIKLPYSEEYRPHFVIYKLWGEDLKRCLMGPMLMVELLNKKELQFNIPYMRHNLLFNDAVECFKKQIAISMCGNVTIKTFTKLVDFYLCNDYLVKINPVRQALLFRLKIYTSLYVGDNTDKILEQIVSFSKKWNMAFFESQLGNFDLWFKALEDEVSHKDVFFNHIKENKLNTKIAKLYSSELIV